VCVRKKLCVSVGEERFTGIDSYGICCMYTHMCVRVFDSESERERETERECVCV